MQRRTLLKALAAGGLLPVAGVAAAAVPFRDVLETPAQKSPLAARGLVSGLTRAGKRLVAVGQRGHVLLSDDAGKTWQQADVPVSADLVAACFPNEQTGWAVGHDGVILASKDGGLSWSLQLDGLRANAAVAADIKQKAAAQPQSETYKALLAEAARNAELGADKPFLDVWFADERTGYAVGAYNLAFRTDDGGATWTPWFDRTDNPKFLNLYAIRPAGGQLFIVGETGLVLKLDPAAQRFRAVAVPYPGTLLGIVGDSNTLLVYGLRGQAFRSEDAGSSWTKVNAALPATIVAGAALTDQLVLADVSGRLSRSFDGGRTFQPVAAAPSMMVAGIVDAGNGRLALAGARGVAMTALPPR